MKGSNHAPNKVLLLNPPYPAYALRDKYCSSSAKADYIWPPIDLLVLSGILSPFFKIKVTDAIAEKLTIAEALLDITSFNPDVVIFLTCSSTWKSDFNFIKLIKQKIKNVIAIGSGGNLLAQGEKIIRTQSEIDAIMLNFTAAEIVDFISGDFSLPLKNFIIRKDDSISVGEYVKTKNTFSYPIPKHEIFPLKKYQFPLVKSLPFTTVITDFGCPFSCHFCIANILPFATRDIDNIMEELAHIKRLGINEIFFVDFAFGVNNKHTNIICEEMIKRKYNFTWSCQSRVDIDMELLSKMKEAGCHTIQFGVESENLQTIERYEKKITKQQVKDVFKLCKDIGIRTSGYFMFGLPGETEDNMRKTIDFAKELDCDYASFAVTIPREGTRFYEDCIKDGLINDIPIEMDSNFFPVMKTKELSAEIIWKYRNKAIKEFYFRPSYIWKKLVNVGSFLELKFLIKEGLSLLKSLFRKEAKKVSVFGSDNF